jgi:hypothetical protein
MTRRRVVQGKKSMNWASRVLTAFMAIASGMKPERLHESSLDVQIDNILHRFKSRQKFGFPAHRDCFNQKLLNI